MDNEKLFLVIDDDDHTDPVYYLRRDKQEALDFARKISDNAKADYGEMPSYSVPCDGRDGWWFCESGEEKWRVTVFEVTVK